MVAQPLGDDHRHAEVVMLLADRLSDVQANPYPQATALLLVLIVAMHLLLHRHGTGEAVQGSGERHHKAVT
jgi:hypothetical protein